MPRQIIGKMQLLTQNIKVCHGSDTNYIFNGLFPEGEVSEADQKLSKSVAASFINFAYTGSPVIPDDECFQNWPEAFADAEYLNGEGESGPSTINIQLIGGPFGTGPCSLRPTYDTARIPGAQEAGRMQQPLAGGFEYGEMESDLSQARREQLQRQKLLERCAFINTLAPKLGV